LSTFGRAAALHPVPFLRNVAQTLASASIALCRFETNVMDKLAELASNSARHMARHRVSGFSFTSKGDPQITPISPIEFKNLWNRRNLRIPVFNHDQDNSGGPSATKKPRPELGHGSA